MPKGIRKIELMHQQFGRCDGHTCGECSNLTTHCYGRTYQKCLVYGESSSEASDWTKRWPACGMLALITASSPSDAAFQTFGDAIYSVGG